MPTIREKGSTSYSKSKVKTYATIAFIGLAGTLATLWGMVWKAEMLVKFGLTGHFYFIVLELLAAFLALLLFGTLESYAQYRGKFLAGTLTLGGPVVLLLVVPVIGFWLQPASNFSLTVYVHGRRGKQDLVIRRKGSVRIDIGGLPRTASIGDEGEAYFPEIPANFRGQEVNVSIDSPDYELSQRNQTIRLGSSAVYVQVDRKPAQFVGQVHDDGGKPLGGVRISIGAIEGLTDAAGHFQLIVPGDQVQSSMTLQAQAAKYLPLSEIVVPNSNELRITLKH